MSESFNIDVKGRSRGKCNCGKCDGFLLINKDKSCNGWCQYCNHPPVDHEEMKDATEKIADLTFLPLAESTNLEAAGSLQDGHKDLIMPADELFVNNQISVSQSARKKGYKQIPLPEFSSVVKPLLHGEPLTKKDHSKLSSILKEEIISYLNHENLICNGNSGIKRWEYRNLGESLASQYPKMLFDLPSHREKKIQKANSPIYGVFIHRLSERRKMKRLRQKAKEMEAIQSSTNAIEVKGMEISPKDAMSELEGSFETIEVQCATAEDLECLKDFDASELSYLEIPVTLIPDTSKQGSLPSSSGEIHTVLRAPLNPSIPPSNSSIPPSNSSIPPSNSSIPSLNPSIPPLNPSIPPLNPSIPPLNASIPPLNSSIPPNETNTSGKNLYQWRSGKKQLLAPGKEAEERLKRQILMEEHEWNWERFNMEKEKRVLEMKLMNEQLKMYEVINERIDKGEGIQISININK